MSLIRKCRIYSARHFESIRSKIRNNFSFVSCEEIFDQFGEGGGVGADIALLLKDYGYMLGSLSFLICLRLVSVNVKSYCVLLQVIRCAKTISDVSKIHHHILTLLENCRSHQIILNKALHYILDKMYTPHLSHLIHTDHQQLQLLAMMYTIKLPSLFR